MNTRRLDIGILSLALVFGGSPAARGAAANQLTAEEQAAGWKVLFNGKNLEGWHSFHKESFPTHGWSVEDGWLHCLGTDGGDLISEAEFGDFELVWEWKQATNGNSGLKYFISEAGNDPRGYEYQMIDDARNEDAKLAGGKRVSGSFYDVLKPTSQKSRPAGETNQARIIVSGGRIEHWLNGEKVLEYKAGSEELKAAIANSKFKSAPGFADKTRGHLLLQDHHSEVWFRNVKVRAIALPN